jgi:NADPH-dependent glutamate synthase beta subunit-like oxidoreductase
VSSPYFDELKVSLLIPRSRTSTEANRTGEWSFSRPAYRDKTAPCRAACPCATDIPRVETLVAEGRLDEALAAILEENPLPAVCGRVCFHPCESRCNRSELDEAVSVNALERFVSDREAVRCDREEVRCDRGIARAEGPASLGDGAAAKGSVAIVGSGPAGLAAAYFMNALGYACEILEAESEAGGLLRYGIPAYRLPPAALRRDLARIEAAGARFRFRERIGERDLARLRSRFSAVIIASGHAKARSLGVPGEELAEDALGFLRRTRLGGSEPGHSSARTGARGKVAVIGGGNTAIDAARSLVRLGCEATIVYRRRRADMPAFPEEVEAAIDEGVELVETAVPIRLERSPAGISLSVQATRPEGAGLDGRPSFVPVHGEVRVLEVAAALCAVGAEAAEPWMKPRESALSLRRCAIELDGPAAPLAFVGDLRGPRETVADAVASGKEAAIALDALFRSGRDSIAGETERCRVGDGEGLSMAAYMGGPKAAPSRRVVAFRDLNTDYFRLSPRKVGPVIPADRARDAFAEARDGLAREDAIAQASRCLSCGRCNDCDNCRTFCPELAVRATPEREREIDEYHCKGCGLCAAECPRSAIEMEVQAP